MIETSDFIADLEILINEFLFVEYPTSVIMVREFCDEIT